MREYETHVSFGKDKHEVVGYCDALRAVASGKTKAEARRNLFTAIQKMLDEYGDEVQARLKGRWGRFGAPEILQTTAGTKRTAERLKEKRPCARPRTEEAI